MALRLILVGEIVSDGAVEGEEEVWKVDSHRGDG